MLVARIASFVGGLLIVGATLGSAVRTVVLPRGVAARLARGVFRAMRVLFRIRTGRRPGYERVDRVMAMYAPVSLLVLVLTWESSVLAGYAAMFWAIGVRPVGSAFRASGSSLLTLGTERVAGLAGTALMFSEAALGLLLLALLITFLPSLYSSFSKRELQVALLEVRAGAPPTAAEMISRYHRIHGLERLGEVWPQWEVWFAELEETHTSFPALCFFRSPQPGHSWVTAAGAVLDAAALRASTLDLPREPQVELCIRAGYLALRRIAGFFSIPYEPNPGPTDQISITKGEYDEMCEQLSSQRIRLKPDRERAWRDFAGWRVNYDSVLLALAALTIAPNAPWSSDRAHLYWKFGPLGLRPQRLGGPSASSNQETR